ncbi:MAG: signal peptidase I, partial [Lachnospiraceae bacterium]|nr:signal peptidase I [Lachnospiraceae bacterium]
MAHDIREFFKSLIIAILAAGFISNFIIAVAYIPSGSMESTMMTGDRVIGSRLGFSGNGIKHGDVAIFLHGYTCKECGKQYQKENGKCPYCGASDSHNKKIYFTKRIIGLPGDTIDIVPTDIYSSDSLVMGTKYTDPQFYRALVMVNGKALDEKYISEPMICDNLEYPSIHVKVPDGCYYALGDNRNNSDDSRFWQDPFIKETDMVAKVLFCFYPFKD